MHRRLPCNILQLQHSPLVMKGLIGHLSESPCTSLLELMYPDILLFRWQQVIHQSRQHQIFPLAGDTCSLRVLAPTWDSYGYGVTQLMRKRGKTSKLFKTNLKTEQANTVKLERITDFGPLIKTYIYIYYIDNIDHIDHIPRECAPLCLSRLRRSAWVASLEASWRTFTWVVFFADVGCYHFKGAYSRQEAWRG